MQQTVKLVRDNIPLKEEFLDILGICQNVWPIREEHAFYIEQASGSQIRRVLVECGLHLTQENVIDSVQDVFYLTLEELKEALSDPQHADLKEIAQSRKDERDRFMRITPPQFLGRAPPNERQSPHFTRPNIKTSLYLVGSLKSEPHIGTRDPRLFCPSPVER